MLPVSTIVHTDLEYLAQNLSIDFLSFMLAAEPDEIRVMMRGAARIDYDMGCKINVAAHSFRHIACNSSKGRAQACTWLMRHTYTTQGHTPSYLVRQGRLEDVKRACDDFLRRHNRPPYWRR